MSGDVHVRFCEGVGVRFPRATHLVVLHNTWEGIQRCKEAIQAWLKGMGLELKDATTRFAHPLEAKEECHGNVGFNFLGCTIRQFPVGKYKSKKRYKTIIQPSKNSIELTVRSFWKLISKNWKFSYE